MECWRKREAFLDLVLTVVVVKMLQIDYCDPSTDSIAVVAELVAVVVAVAAVTAVVE